MILYQPEYKKNLMCATICNSHYATYRHMNTNVCIDLPTWSNYSPALSPSMHYYILVNNKFTECYILLFSLLVPQTDSIKNIIVITFPTFLNLSPSYFVLKWKIKYSKDKKLITVTGI